MTGILTLEVLVHGHLSQICVSFRQTVVITVGRLEVFGSTVHAVNNDVIDVDGIKPQLMGIAGNTPNSVKEN